MTSVGPHTESGNAADQERRQGRQHPRNRPSHRPRWLTPWRWLPAYAVNGIEVALGIACAQLLATWVLSAWGQSPHAAALVVSGAVCASIADLPNAPSRAWRRVGMAALLSALSVAAMDLLRPHPMALGVAVMVVTGVAMMTLAWGPRAGAVSFAPVLAMIFALAVPPAPHPLANAGFSAIGSLLFVGWALLASALLQPLYRRLALVQALRAAADLFSARADVLAPRLAAAQAKAGPPLQAWISGEAALADRLQAARDLLFAAPPSPRQQRDVALLLRVIDLRDVLLASRLDADLLGRDELGAAVLTHIAATLRRIGQALAAAAGHVQHGSVPRGDDDLAPPTTTAAFADIRLPPGDHRARLLPPLAGRLQQLSADTARIRQLLQGQREPLPLTADQLQRFVAPEGWPLRALRPHLRLDAPVLRHALRMALALGSAYFLALLLPWGAHPYWLILSVAVVLRNNLGDTLLRRNARVLGTILGCLVVVGLSHLPLPGLLSVVFIVALGTAHAFTLQRYWLTATAASVMALLQAHLVNPAAGFAIAERVADTFLGALIAWLFSYVLPSWERRRLPAAVAAVLRDLRAYAALSLRSLGAAEDPVAERLARRQAYDALSALSAALQRSRVEPRGVRLPAAQLAHLLDHGERLMAHLSMVRLMRARGSSLQLGDASRADVDTALAGAAAGLQARLDLPADLQRTATAEQAAAAIGPPAAPPAALSLLPEQDPSHDVRPWLARRLDLLLYEATLAGAAARAALVAH